MRLVLPERELHRRRRARRRHQLELEAIHLQVLVIGQPRRRALDRDLQHAVDGVHHAVELRRVLQFHRVVPGLLCLVVADDLLLQLDLDVGEMYPPDRDHLPG